MDPGPDNSAAPGPATHLNNGCCCCCFWGSTENDGFFYDQITGDSILHVDRTPHSRHFPEGWVWPLPHKLIPRSSSPVARQAFPLPAAAEAVARCASLCMFARPSSCQWINVTKTPPGNKAAQIMPKESGCKQQPGNTQTERCTTETFSFHEIKQFETAAAAWRMLLESVGEKFGQRSFSVHVWIEWSVQEHNL